MPDKHLYEYAVLRLIPCVDRGESINIGVALYCKSKRFLDFKYHLNPDRLKAFHKDIDLEEVNEHLSSFDKICKGTSDSGLIGEQDQASRFRWLTARRSTIIQASAVHPGYCNEPTQAIEEIYAKMVL
ncbi:DUF3037 domain-containing protein [Arcticibacterium luteifluviistationis]|uniref:DUF3037 domain-containing protein n=1 Tax=Arcticibacterium luteifluviistationis TaxID=1784714 RepID=A0A2Z4GEB5_9BACT|nr:DUF3037 domain-containing protein [Arcticibacterium luteifluviistationis]AWV99652.1 DUF3037 domain-containing protein [Arcticibacterium luteifluviistationis]